MSNPPDPDFSSFPTLPAAGSPSGASKAEDVTAAVKTAVTKLGETNKGTAPSSAASAASEIANAARTMADNIALAEQAAKDLVAAKAAWEKAAAGAKQADLDAADKAVSDARQTLADAAKAEDEARDRVNSVQPGEVTVNNYANELATAAAATSKAEEDLQKARDHAAALHKQSKDAFEALRAALQRIADTLKRVNGATISSGDTNRDGGTGVGMPGDGKPAGTGTQSPGADAPAGTPAGKGAPSGTPAGTPKPAGTPAATPSGTQTNTSNGKGSGLDASDVATIAAAAGQSQNGQQQQPQAQQASTAMPTMPQVPQTNQQDGKGRDTEKPPGDKIAESALGPSALLSSFNNSSHATPSTPAPAAQPTTQFRGPDTKIAGVGLGGSPAVNTQNPVTSGTSQTGLTTPADTTGRPQGTQNTAFSATPGGAETKTSGAHGTETTQNQGAQQRTPGTGMAPGMMPLAPGAAGPSYGSPANRDEKGRITGYGNNPQTLLLNGGYTVGETVRGGTICQALRQENQDLIRV